MKHLNVYLFLILLTTVLVQSCSQDDTFEELKHENELAKKPTFDKYTVLHKNGNFLEGDEFLNQELEELKTTFNSKTQTFKSSNVNLEIFTENITYIYSPEDSTETYTFYVIRENLRSKYIIENLVLERKKGEDFFNSYFVKYFLKNGLDNPEEHIEIVNIEPINFENISKSLNKCVSTWNYEVVELEHDCGSGTHSGDDQYEVCELSGEAKPYSTFSIEFVFNDCGTGGGSTSPGDPGTEDPETGTGGGNSGPGGDPDGTDTGITLPPGCPNVSCSSDDILANQINDLLNDSLSYEELVWLNSNETEALSIQSFLTNNPLINRLEVIHISREAIQYLERGRVSTFQEFLNKTRTFLNNNISNDLDNNTEGGIDTTSYPSFNPTQETWSSIAPIISENEFIGWGHPNIPYNCMDYAKAQINLKGYQISNYFNQHNQTLQIYTEQNGVNQTKTTEALNYLKYALQNNIPVIVGIDLKSGTANPQTDNTTDHFVVIVGMGTDNKGKYFRFFDNASGLPESGANPLNRLYYNLDTGKIKGKSLTTYGTNSAHHDYIVTQVRKSKVIQ